MSQVKANTVRKGAYITHKSQPHIVLTTSFINPGRGSAFARLKLKNVKTGSTEEVTYKSHDSVELLEVTSTQYQFLYLEGSEVVLMDPRTYQQLEVSREFFEGKERLLSSESLVYVLQLDEEPLGVIMPPKVTLTVTRAEPAVAGNTVGQAKKTVEVETGAKLQVPIFVSEGERIIIDTETENYLSRASE